MVFIFKLFSSKDKQNISNLESIFVSIICMFSFLIFSELIIHNFLQFLKQYKKSKIQKKNLFLFCQRY